MPTSRSHDKILFFPQAATNTWIENYYLAELTGKNEATIDAYLRILRQLTSWIAKLPGSEGSFHPRFLTKTAFSDYLEELKDYEYSTSHLERVKTVTNGFANWLIAEANSGRTQLAASLLLHKLYWLRVNCQKINDSCCVIL